ncbi:hypothetical protein Droror1_Dr00016746 [Drosera rotundifolia]
MKIQLSHLPYLLPLLCILLLASCHRLDEADPLVDSICRKTRNPNLCTQCLQSKDIQLPSRDLKGYAYMSLRCPYYACGVASDILSRRNSSISEDLKKAYSKCVVKLFLIDLDLTNATQLWQSADYGGALVTVQYGNFAFAQGCLPVISLKPSLVIRARDFLNDAEDIFKQLVSP